MITQLRSVTLHGPALPGQPDKYFWTLTASAPRVDYLNIPDKKAIQEDRIHSVRVLAIDPTPGAGGMPIWRIPRLMSVHLLAGHPDGFYSYGDEEVLTSELPFERDGKPSSKEIQRPANDGSVFRTADPDPKKPFDPKKAIFQHVIAEPILGPDGLWPPDQDEKTIDIPPMRLVAGAVELAVLEQNFGWLGGISPIAEETMVTGAAAKKVFRLRLTPDGIEIITDKAPIPAAGGPKNLKGRFLLAPTERELTLTLLPERTEEEFRTAWRDAWQAVSPITDKAEDALHGFKISTRRNGLPPAFRWRVNFDLMAGSLSAPLPIVEVPVADVRMELLSPRGSAGIDGVASVRPEVVRLAQRSALTSLNLKKLVFGDPATHAAFERVAGDAQVVLTARVPQHSGDGDYGKDKDKTANAISTRMLLTSKDNILRATLTPIESIHEKLEDVPAVSYHCAHDEHELAAKLRQAQGLIDPKPGASDLDHPLLSAFVPLEDGWLQLPVPNVPPADFNQDREVLTAPVPRPPNVLGGYLRFAQAGNLPTVLSAFPSTQAQNATQLITEAPWAITVEGAQAVMIAIAINPGGDDNLLGGGVAALDGPELSTRGLLWLSSDRPDALEALPRLGAGPGTYLDVPIETYDTERKPTVAITIGALSLKAISREEEEAPAEITREALSLDIAFDPEGGEWEKIIGEDEDTSARQVLAAARTILVGGVVDPKSPLPLPAVVWQRHPRMPLAATMPMTRVASSAVRPLESRDLLPFVVKCNLHGEDKVVSLATLTWKKEHADAVFPSIGMPNLAPVAGWPWPDVKSEDPPDRGIAVSAFGVPGAELAFQKTDTAGLKSDPWTDLSAALRYDLPVLDEAFATATLPPQPADKASPDEPEKVPVNPIPTALDWVLMKSFWDDQERRHQLARVMHSYLLGYRKFGTDKKAKVKTLIAGVTWTTELGFKPPADGESIPYGMATVAGEEVNGNLALLGHSGEYEINGSELVQDEKSKITVIGYSPSSFEEDGFLMDSRRTGVKEAQLVANGAVLWRPIRIAVGQEGDYGKAIGFASLIDTLTVKSGGPEKENIDLFEFWFKDVPLAEDGTFERSDRGVDPQAWQDGHLPEAGYEWRLIPAFDKALGIFKRGRDRIPFFGFSLEPLRLLKLTAEMNANVPSAVPKEVQLLARLRLGPRRETAEEGGNLVVLTLEGTDCELVVKTFAVDPPEKKLHFVLDASEDSKKDTPSRWTVVELTPEWKDGRPQISDASITIEMFGTEVTLHNPEVTASEAATQVGNLVMKWQPSRHDQTKIPPGTGQIAVTELQLTVCVEANGEEKQATLSLSREISIAPLARHRRVNEKEALDFVAAPITMTIAGNNPSSLKIVGLGANLDLDKVNFNEEDGALTLTLVKNLESGERLLPGFPDRGVLSLALASRILGFDKDGVARLTAGVIDGEIVWKQDRDKRIGIERIGIAAECGRRKPSPYTGIAEPKEGSKPTWIGHLALSGVIKIDNAISWPVVNMEGSEKEIPYPPASGVSPDGRTVVKLADPAQCYAHQVEWLLDGHQLSFEIASGIEGCQTVWTIPVVARHILTLNSTEPKFSFTGVEVITLGGAKAIIPAPIEPNEEEKRAVTFAPRYRHKMKDGSDLRQPTDPGMVQAGMGAIGTVLHGALGRDFRRFLHSSGTNHTELLIAGGFIGALATADGEMVPLLRLPVLTALDPETTLGRAGVIRQTDVPPEEGIEVAWADGAAVRDLIATLRGAIAPKSGTETALRAALAAGSRPLPKSLIPHGDAALAVLIEQSFPVKLEATSLGETPFFIASAVSVSRVFQKIQGDQTQNPTTLSLVAGTETVENQGKPEDSRIHHGLAAAIATRDLPLVYKRPTLSGELTTIGDDVVSVPWTGPSPSETGENPPPSLVIGRALADHVRPRAVLLQTVDETSGQRRYDRLDLPRPPLRARVRSAVSNRAFADAGRGYALPPGDAPLRWLGGPEEGHSIPIRDAAPSPQELEPITHSGIAGLSHRMGLPAQAVAVEPPPEEPDKDKPDPAVSRLVWIAQSHVPVYPPLALKDLISPPIPWLSPGAPRTRLPADQALDELFYKKLDYEPPSKLPAKPGAWRGLQPIVPERATGTGVGERPGVLIVRQLGLETPVGNIAAFDLNHGRFGRPGQASTSIPKTERIPRPGPLPENTGDPARDRRPCASPLLPKRPLRALVGPADVVRGEAFEGNESTPGIGAWSVTFVAAPETEGMITESWDGTVRLLAEVDIACREGNKTPPDDFCEMLFRLLFPEDASGGLQARASLVIGGTVIPFLRLHVDGSKSTTQFLAHDGEETNPPSKSSKVGSVIHRNVISLILDPRDGDGSRQAGRAHPDIAATLAGDGALPPIAVQLTVHPDSTREFEGMPVNCVFNLTQIDPKKPKLSAGERRAPVTLRLPLAPVTKARGALPLVPCSLLFTDPAYDAGLAAQPVEVSQRLDPIVKSGKLPIGRGALLAVLSADRARVNRRGTITFMLDLRFEKPSDARVRAFANEEIAGKLDGDIVGEVTEGFQLRLALQPRVGDRRMLYVGIAKATPDPAMKELRIPELGLACVHEIALDSLIESDGTAARLAAGDVLEMEVSGNETSRVDISVWNSENGNEVSLDSLGKEPVLTLRFVLTNEPVVEPPPALYAALVHTANGVAKPLETPTPSRLSLPLYAQSPLPWRIDLCDAKADFRAGLMRRTATFVWTLARPRSEINRLGIHIVKCDRNGQTYLPPAKGEVSADFIRPESLLR